MKLQLLTTILLLFVSVISLSNSGFERNDGQFRTPNGEKNSDVLFCFQNDRFKVSLRTNGFSYEVVTLLNREALSEIEEQLDNTKLDIHHERIDFIFPQSPEEIISSKKTSSSKRYYTKDGLMASESFSKIVYYDVMNGFDLEFIVSNGKFKYNIIKNKGVELSDFYLDIKMDGLLEKKDDQLNFKLEKTKITETIPLSYIARTHESKKVSYVLSDDRISFTADGVRSDEKLIIDPEPDMVWSTFFGGDQYDFLTDASIGLGDTLYTVGMTMSSNNISTSGAHQTTYQGDLDVCISKFVKNGDLLWSTYYAGPQSERCYAIFIDENNELYVSGSTFSNIGFVTGGAHQSAIDGADDLFILKMNSLGTREWGTYHGGNGHDFVTDIHVENDTIFLVGHTTSTNNIATNGAHQSTFTANEAGHLTLFNTVGQHLLGTYYGSEQNNSIEGVAVTENRIFLTGRTSGTTGISTPGAFQENLAGFTNAFVSSFSKSGNQIWGSYFGGQYTDVGKDIALDTSGGIFIVGDASSENNISTPGAFQETRLSSEQGFIAHFNKDGNRLWGTYTGGIGTDYVSVVESNSLGSIFVGGNTTSTENITSTDAYQTNTSGGYDVFIQRFDFDGSFEWGTYLGGVGDEDITSLEINQSNNLVVSGSTNQNDTVFGIGNSLNNQYNGGTIDGFISYLCQLTEPEIIYTDDSLTTISADQYQWYLDGQPLNLFTQTIEPPADGYYTVETSSYGKCETVSDTFLYSTTGMNQHKNQNILVYPNPTSSFINIETSTVSQVYVTDLTGRLIADFQCANHLTIDFRAFKDGLYIITVDDGVNSFKKSIIKV